MESLDVTITATHVPAHDAGFVIVTVTYIFNYGSQFWKRIRRATITEEDFKRSGQDAGIRKLQESAIRKSIRTIFIGPILLKNRGKTDGSGICPY